MHDIAQQILEWYFILHFEVKPILQNDILKCPQVYLGIGLFSDHLHLLLVLKFLDLVSEFLL